MKYMFLAAILGLAFSATAQNAAPSTATNAIPATALSDAQIEQILATADKGEIEAAKLAKSKTKNADIKAFAKMMIDQHEQNEKGLKSIEKSQSIRPADSDLSASLKDEAKQGYKDLKASNEFDKAYIGQQLAAHQKVLDALNTKLIPDAQNADLKAFLEKTRDAVAMHLDHAKQIQAKFQ